MLYINKMKMQPTKWEKTFANHISENPKQPNLKIGRGSEYIFFQRTHTNGQQVHENVFNITNHQGNANQNHREISPHTC